VVVIRATEAEIAYFALRSDSLPLHLGEAGVSSTRPPVRVIRSHAALEWGAVPAADLDARVRPLGVLIWLSRQDCVSGTGAARPLERDLPHQEACEIVAPCCVTVVCMRRTAAQLAAVQELFERVMRHLWSCLFDEPASSSSPFPLLVRCGGVLDCMWLACLHDMSLAVDASPEDRALQNDACTALHDALSALLATLADAGSQHTPEAFQERVERCVTVCRRLIGAHSSDNVNPASLLDVDGPLEELPCSDSARRTWSVEAVAEREASLRDATAFAALLQTPSLERCWAWNVDLGVTRSLVLT